LCDKEREEVLRIRKGRTKSYVLFLVYGPLMGSQKRFKIKNIILLSATKIKMPSLAPLILSSCQEGFIKN